MTETEIAALIERYCFARDEHDNMVMVRGIVLAAQEIRRALAEKAKEQPA